MYDLKFLLLCLLVVIGSAVTDITLLNCPSSYLKSTPQQQEDGFVDFGETLYAAYQSSSASDSMYKIIIQGDTQQLQGRMALLQIPFILIGVGFVIVMTMVICWCLFSRSCPPWQWTKRDPMIHPYTSKQMNYTFFWLTLFSVSILVLSVLVMSQIPNLKTNIQDTQCSLFVIVDTTLNGDDSGWAGFSSFKDNVGNVSSLISSTNTQIGLYFTGDEWLINDMTTMKIKNNRIYLQNQDAQLTSPNPFTTATQLDAGFPAPLIDSVFIKTGLGPTGQSQRMTTQILAGLQTTQILSRKAYDIDQSSRLVGASSSTIRSNFIGVQNTLSMYIHQLDQYKDYLNIFSEKYFIGQFSTFLYIIQIVIAVLLIATLLTLIGSFSASIFHLLDCRKMVHMGWMIFSFGFLGSLILGYIFLGLGSISYSFCGYFNNFLHGQETFNSILSQNNQNIINKLDTCIYGQGNVLQSFLIDDQMNTLTQLYTHIQTYNAYTNISSHDYVNTTFSIEKLSKWIQIIQNYKLGIFIDSNPVQTNEDNPNYAIQQLNLYSNTGGGVPTCSNDRWVFDKVNCTLSGQIIYETTDETNGASLSQNNVTCISFNEGFALSYNRSWTHDDFIKRYIQIRQQCGAAYDNIIKFGTTLINFRDSRYNLFQGIQDSLEEIKANNEDFNSLLGTFKSRVTQFSDSTKNMKNLLLSESAGITYTANCSTIGKKVKDTHVIFCRNFMSQVVRIGLIVVLLLILVPLAIWMGSLFAVRYSQIQKHESLNAPSSETDSQRVISDNKSSDQD